MIGRMVWKVLKPERGFKKRAFLNVKKIGDLKITSTSTERQKRSQNLAPVLVIISGNSLVFSRKIITSTTGFYRCCAAGAPAPVVRGRKNNKHKQLRGIIPEMGGGQIVYVFPFFLGKKGNT